MKRSQAVAFFAKNAKVLRNIRLSLSLWVGGEMKPD
jgi:hypothetical protein